MSIGIFTDKSQSPTRLQIAEAIGTQYPAWEELTQFIRENYTVQEDFGFYGKNYGWAVRFRKGGKALAALYPTQNSFAVQVILGEAEIRIALRLKISRRVRDIIEAAHPFAEGRWLFIPIKSGQDIRDVKQLLALKSPPHAAVKAARASKNKPKEHNA